MKYREIYILRLLFTAILTMAMVLTSCTPGNKTETYTTKNTETTSSITTQETTSSTTKQETSLTTSDETTYFTSYTTSTDTIFTTSQTTSQTSSQTTSQTSSQDTTQIVTESTSEITTTEEQTTESNNIRLTDKGYYYEVVIDYTSGVAPYNIMAEYGQILAARCPDIQAAIDQFLYDLVNSGIDMYMEDMGIDLPPSMSSMAINLITGQFIERIASVKPQIPTEYQDELEGLASTLTNSENDRLGDGLLTKNELYFYHLIGDVARTNQCSAIGIYSPISESGSSIIGRNFDLDADMAEYNAVIKIKREQNSVYIIGWLANMSAFTGFNEDGLFGAIVDTTGSGEEYTSEGIHSYAFDLRYSLENESSIDGAVDYLSRYPYSFNHLIFLADSERSGILENNISGSGTDMHRELRTDLSELNSGIEWDYENIVVAVSAFMLLGNHDNFTDCLIATARLESYKALLYDAFSDGIISFEEVKEIQSYCGIDGIPTDMSEGDLYNTCTRRIVIFQFDPIRLEIYFCGSQSDSPGAMQFVQIELLFE